MILGILMFTSLNLFDEYNENKIPPCPSYCGIEHVHKGEKMDLKKLQAMIQPKTAVPDNTKQQAFEVFNDKSQEGDTIKANALGSLKQMGLSEEDILGIVMGSVGGGVGAGKGIMGALKGLKGGLKGLAGKIGSKAKFPKGYGASQSPGASPDTPAFIRKALDKKMNPIEQMKNEKQTRATIQQSIQQLMKPNTVIKEEGIQKALKGTRKTGIRG